MTIEGSAGRAGVEPRPAAARLRCVVSSLPSDAHTWALVVLQLLIEQRGHEVVNLGPCPPQQMIVDACRRRQTDLLVLSSSNGHGLLEAERLIDRLRGIRELAPMRIVLGGKLDCRDDGAWANALLRARGVDAVYADADGLRPFVTLLDDLGRFGGRRDRLRSAA